MTLNLDDLTATWQHLHALAHDAIVPITDEGGYDRALAMLDALLKKVGEDESHPLADLIEGLIGRVTAYQDVAQHVPPAPADMALRLLIKERGLTQQQVAEGTGIPQGNLSKLAGGKRAFTADHARRLAGFFRVNPALFL